jgi:hypothetical protein
MRVLLTFFLFGVLALSGCSRNTASRPSKSELEQNIKNKMATEPELATAIVITVDPDKNEVVLTGVVPTESLRTEAVQLTKSAQDGLAVTDKIDVKLHELSRSEYTEFLPDLREHAFQRQRAAPLPPSAPEK